LATRVRVQSSSTSNTTARRPGQATSVASIWKQSRGRAKQKRRQELRGRLAGLRTSRSRRSNTRLMVERDGTDHAGPVRAQMRIRASRI
jgi:hypothetical protein